MGGFASSRILEVHGERMIKRTFNPGFKIALHQKDLNLGTAKCESTGAEPAKHRDLPGNCLIPVRQTVAASWITLR